MQLFGQRGVKATTMRAIADAVGVSPALIVHHFGSKDGLRDAVDASVTERFQSLADKTMAGLQGRASATVHEMVEEALTPDPEDNTNGLVRSLLTDEALSSYLRRLFMEDDPAGHRIFESWLRMTVDMLTMWSDQGVIARPTDITLRAAALLSNDMASFLLRPYLHNALGWDPLSVEGAPRWTEEILTIYSGKALAPRHTEGELNV